MWAGFGVFVLAALAVDMFLLDRHGAQKVSLRGALTWSLVWFAMAIMFGGALWGWLDHAAGREVADTKVMEYLTGYLLEKTLAMDNLFVFVMLFSYFAVPRVYQKRVPTLHHRNALAVAAIEHGVIRELAFPPQHVETHILRVGGNGAVAVGIVLEEQVGRVAAAAHQKWRCCVTLRMPKLIETESETWPPTLNSNLSSYSAGSPHW